MNLIEHIHGSYVHSRRARVLSDHLGGLIPHGSRVLDVGCGDGLLAGLIMKTRSGLDLRGIDVLVRDQTHIPVEAFNGRVFPYDDESFDVVMFVDVLHHTDDPIVLLREAVRTARKSVLIKDHTRNGFLAGPTLRLLDWVGNARHGVALPYNYWRQEKWFETFNTLDLEVVVWNKDLGLYSPPANWLFERSLHFVARVDVRRAKCAG